MSRRWSRMRRCLAAGWLIVGLARLAPTQTAPPAAGPTVILFVGNSFTYGGSTAVRGYNSREVTDENSHGTPLTGGIPGIFKKLTDEAGLRYEVHVETVGGQTLEYHYQHSLPLIRQDKWDDVVLQGYSTEPLPEARDGKQDDFVKYATLLEQAVHEVRPTAKLYLYQTWPYPYKAYPENPSNPLEPLFRMGNDLHSGYERAFGEDRHFEKIVPVGEAWMRALGQNLATAHPKEPLRPGQINLWDKDDKHPSVEGSYLAALVLFEEITGADARKFGPQERAARELGIPPEDAAKLQGTADAEVRGVKW